MVWLVMSSVLVSLIVTLIFLPAWIKKAKKIGLVLEDMNVVGAPKRFAASGGVVILMAFVLGVLFYVAFTTFILESNSTTIMIFALLAVVLILGFIGVVDDMLGWRHGGLSAKVRVLLALFASIPLVVINAGMPEVSLPFFGAVNLGLIYPLILIPIAVAGVSTVYNFLAGMRGLEAGLGILVVGFLSFVAYATGSSWLAVVGLCMVAALVVFYYYNHVLGAVLPGDSGTYAIGGLIACMAILGNFERIAFVVFIPFLIEMGLKLRGRLQKYSFGKPEKDGGLKMLYPKIYGLTHFSIWLLSKFKRKVREKDVVYFIFLIQIVFILIGFLML